MSVTCVTILWATLVVASAKTHLSKSSSKEKNSGNTIIENKNVNVIVNVNAQELALELWKIIESRLNNCTNHTSSSNSIVEDLKEAITPLVSPNRRSSTPSAFQVASQLDSITRRALIRNMPNINMLDEEIMARDIVADMMASMKIFLSKQAAKKGPSRRMMHRPAATTMYDNKEDNYVNIRIKINRKDIFNAFH
ncbi:uncharacterized protein LOC118646106 [Monomorium pharaonis]|uniref:uncharacterized protein LOC118646106 n=1 Tax=Monomorium pharaonis TaxID=307658 RepID=UPI0017463DDC|nr:uncharacterized protein LOC118646106 [Monomorium pharaonis]